MITSAAVFLYIPGIIVVFAIVFKTVSYIKIRKEIRKTLNDISSLPSSEKQVSIDKIQANLTRKLTNGYDCIAFAGTISFLILIFSILIRAIDYVEEIQAPYIETRIMLYITYVFSLALVIIGWVFIAVIAHYMYKVWGRRILYNFEEKVRQLVQSEKWKSLSWVMK